MRGSRDALRASAGLDPRKSASNRRRPAANVDRRRALAQKILFRHGIAAIFKDRVQENRNLIAPNPIAKRLDLSTVFVLLQWISNIKNKGFRARGESPVPA
jgi:hypothetical protein